MTTLNRVQVQAFVQTFVHKFDREYKYDFVPVGWEGIDPDMLRINRALNDAELPHPVSALLSDLASKSAHQQLEHARQERVFTYIRNGLYDWGIPLNWDDLIHGLSPVDKLFATVFAGAWSKFSLEEKQQLLTQISQTGVPIDARWYRIERATIYQVARVYRSINDLCHMQMLVHSYLGTFFTKPWMGIYALPLAQRFVENYISVAVKAKGQLVYQIAIKITTYLGATKIGKIMSYKVKIVGGFSVGFFVYWVVIHRILSGIAPLYPWCLNVARGDILSLGFQVLGRILHHPAAQLQQLLLDDIKEEAEREQVIRVYQAFRTCVHNYPPAPAA